MKDKQLPKVKKCTVRLLKMRYLGITPSEIQEQIVDQRIRKCSVRLKRWTDEQIYELKKSKSKPTTIIHGFKTRHFSIRVERLPLGYTDITSSPQTASDVSGSMFSEDDDSDLESNEPQGRI